MDVTEALKSATIKVQTKHGGDIPVLSDGTIEKPAYNELVSVFLGVDAPSARDAEQINEIADWAKERAGDSDVELLALLKDIRYRLGGSSLEPPLTKLHRYVKLRRQAATLDLQAKAMEQ